MDKIKSSGLYKKSNGYSGPANPRSYLKKKFGSGSPLFSFGLGTRIKEDFVEYMSQTQPINIKDIRELPGPANYSPKPEKLNKAAFSWRYFLHKLI